ncbi:MAG: ubiquitin-conjugating enzyme E2 [Bacteroidia bacterium]
MATPQEIRNIRLKNDFKEMCNIKGAMIQWEIVSGTAPFVEEYKLTIKVRTIINNTPTYRNEHILKLLVPSNYPKTAPQIEMQTKPYPFHPNWYTSGKWCHGSWDGSEGLAELVLRMIKTLQFDKEITNPNSAANVDANSWYERNINVGLFPCDTQQLPDPTVNKFNLDNSAPKPKFEIKDSKPGFKINEQEVQANDDSAPPRRFSIN